MKKFLLFSLGLFFSLSINFIVFYFLINYGE